MSSTRRKYLSWSYLLAFVFIALLFVVLVPPHCSRLHGRGHIKVKAKNTLTALVSSVDAYYNTYDRMPVNSAVWPKNDQIVRSDEPVMSVLAGINIEGMNPKETWFFSGEQSKGSRVNEAYYGLWRDASFAKLFDPWKKDAPLERGYLLLLDYDGDWKVEDPFRPGVMIERRVVAWSAGKDGKWKRGNPKRGVNKDNVYSWF